MKKVTKNNIVRKKSWQHWEKVLRKSVQYIEGSFFCGVLIWIIDFYRSMMCTVSTLHMNIVIRRKNGKMYARWACAITMANVLFMPTKPPWKLGKWLSNFKNVSVANFIQLPIFEPFWKNVNFTQKKGRVGNTAKNPNGGVGAI